MNQKQKRVLTNLNMKNHNVNWKNWWSKMERNAKTVDEDPRKNPEREIAMFTRLRFERAISKQNLHLSNFYSN